LEAAFKNETIGLATREEFLSKKNTLKDRLKEHEEQKKRALERQARGPNNLRL
jgi:protein FAM50